MSFALIFTETAVWDEKGIFCLYILLMLSIILKVVLPTDCNVIYCFSLCKMSSY